MNKKEKKQIKYLLENLKWYSEAPNEQDYNGEYEPPMEWEQGEAKVFLKYLEEKEKVLDNLQQKENIIKEVREYIEKEYVQVENKEYNLDWNNLEYIIKEIIDKLNEGKNNV